MAPQASKKQIITEAVALEATWREAEGRYMDQVDMAIWYEILMDAPEAVLADILGDRDKLRAYVRANWGKPRKKWWQFWK